MFVTGAWPVTEQGEAELQSKMLVTSLLSQHLSVVLWFVDVGLLPENDGKVLCHDIDFFPFQFVCKTSNEIHVFC